MLPAMDGVKLAIIGFVFLCIAMPQLVRNRSQFFWGIILFLLAMIFQTIGVMLGSSAAARTVFTVLDLAAQIMAIIALILSTGGFTLKEFAGDLARAYTDLRDGQKEEASLVSLSNQPPKPQYRVDDDEEDEVEISEGGHKRYVLNERQIPGDQGAPPAPTADSRKSDDKGSIPLV